MIFSETDKWIMILFIALLLYIIIPSSRLFSACLFGYSLSKINSSEGLELSLKKPRKVDFSTWFHKIKKSFKKVKGKNAK